MSRLSMALLVVGLYALADPAAPCAGGDDPPKEKDAPQAPPWMNLTAEEFIKRFDANKDGVLTKDELPPGLARNFERFDLDGNGKLDAKEVGQMLETARRRFGDKPPAKPADKPADNEAVERRVNDIFERMDANKDGKISKEEAKNRIADNFDRIDTNKDGYIDKDELRRFVARTMAAGPGGGGPFAAAQGPDFDALDKNADGRLTRDELKGTPFADKFDEIDANKDGKIDKKEWAAWLKRGKAPEEKKPADR